MEIVELKTHGEASRFCEKYGLKVSGLDVRESSFKVAEALQKAQAEGMNKPGECETCHLISWEGELGTIQTCDSEEDLTFSEGKGIELADGSFAPWGECPFWKSDSTPGYCKKHNRWHFNDWEKSCPECYAEYEAEARVEDGKTPEDIDK